MDDVLKEKLREIFDEMLKMKHRINVIENEQHSMKLEEKLLDFRLKMLE